MFEGGREDERDLEGTRRGMGRNLCSWTRERLRGRKTNHFLNGSPLMGQEGEWDTEVMSSGLHLTLRTLYAAVTSLLISVPNIARKTTF